MGMDITICKYNKDGLGIPLFEAHSSSVYVYDVIKHMFECDDDGYIRKIIGIEDLEKIWKELSQCALSNLFYIKTCYPEDHTFEIMIELIDFLKQINKLRKDEDLENYTLDLDIDF